MWELAEELSPARMPEATGSSSAKPKKQKSSAKTKSIVLEEQERLASSSETFPSTSEAASVEAGPGYKLENAAAAGSAPSTPPPSEPSTNTLLSPSGSCDALALEEGSASVPASTVISTVSSSSPGAAQAGDAGAHHRLGSAPASADAGMAGLPRWQYLIFLYGNRLLGLLVACLAFFLKLVERLAPASWNRPKLAIKLPKFPKGPSRVGSSIVPGLKRAAARSSDASIFALGAVVGLIAGVKAVAASLSLLFISSSQTAACSASSRLRTSASKRVSRAAEVAAKTARAGVNGAVYTSGAAVGVVEGIGATAASAATAASSAATGVKRAVATKGASAASAAKAGAIARRDAAAAKIAASAERVSKAAIVSTGATVGVAMGVESVASKVAAAAARAAKRAHTSLLSSARDASSSALAPVASMLPSLRFRGRRAAKAGGPAVPLGARAAAAAAACARKLLLLVAAVLVAPFAAAYAAVSKKLGPLEELEEETGLPYWHHLLFLYGNRLLAAIAVVVSTAIAAAKHVRRTVAKAVAA